MPYKTIPRSFIFSPLEWLDGGARDTLENQFQEQGVEQQFFTLQVVRRCKLWAITLPVGTFSNNLTPGSSSLWTENTARDLFIDSVDRASGRHMFPHKTAMFSLNNEWFYREDAINIFRVFADKNFLFAAAYAIMQAVKKDPSVFPTRKVPRIERSLEDRPVTNGHRPRGPDWSETENALLRRWFGRHPDGKHRPLTENQWRTLLEIDLYNLRTRASVLQQLGALNTKMKRTLMVDGLIPRDRIQEWRANFLGQRYCVPRYRPRLHGGYFSPHDPYNPPGMKP